MVEMVMFNVQRIITPKVGKPESQFMCSAHCLKMFYISVKFRENISNSVRVMEQRQNYKALTDGQTDTQNFRRYNIIAHNFLWQGIKIHVKCLLLILMLGRLDVKCSISLSYYSPGMHVSFYIHKLHCYILYRYKVSILCSLHFQYRPVYLQLQRNMK